LFRVQEAVSSNLAAPTKLKTQEPHENAVLSFFAIKYSI
jgi:hypothetical protein